MLTPAQLHRLEACARVLDPPALVVMTGRVAPLALTALRSHSRAGVEVTIAAPGTVARIEGSIDLLFIGPMAPYSAAAELFARWPGRVAPGGLLFVHGAFAAAPLTAALMSTIGVSRSWRYYGRDGDLAEYVRADLTHGESVLDGLAQVAQLGFFARRVARRGFARNRRPAGATLET